MIDIEELKKLLLEKKPLSVPQDVIVSCHDAAAAIESLQTELENVNRRFNLLMNALRSVYDSLDKSVTQCRELQKENKELKNRIGSSQS